MVAKNYNKSSNNGNVGITAAALTKAKKDLKMISVEATRVAKASAARKYDLEEELGCCERLLNQCLDPCGSATYRWPNLYGLSGIYKAKNILNAKFTPEGRSCCITFPQLRDSIFATVGSPTIQTLPINGSGSELPYIEQEVNVQDFNIPLTNPLYISREAAVPFPHGTDIGQRILYPFAVDAAAPTGGSIALLTISMQGVYVGQATFTLEFFDASYNNISQTVNTTTLNGLSMILLESSTVGAVYMAISVKATDPYHGVIRLNFAAQAASGSWQYALPDHAQHCDVHDLVGAETIYVNAERYFVLAQSLLVTSQLSELTSTGNIASARLPGGSVIGLNSSNTSADDYYSFLSSLPHNSMNGPIQDGSYTFYLPDDESGYFYKDVHRRNIWNLPYMVTEFFVPNVTAGEPSVRLQIDSVVQYTSLSSTVEMHPSDYYGDIERLRYIMSTIHSSYSNDGHIDGLKKALQQAKRKVMTILRNPHTYEQAAKLAGMMGTAAATLL